MDTVADSIVVTSEDACPRDSSTRKSDRPRKLTAKGMENLPGNLGTVMQALIREVRDETMKQMAKSQQETVKEITTSHKRIIETLWNAWKKEQQAFKQMIEGQEKAIRQLQKDIQGIQAQAAQERKLMQEHIDELKRMRQHTSGDSEPLQAQAVDEIKRIHEKLDTLAQRAVAGSAQVNPRQSFADIARMPPTEGQDGGVRGPEPVSSPTPLLSSPGEELFCTIDISGAGDDDSNKAQIGEVRQAIEAAVRTRKKDERWRCAAVVRGARNANIIKVICRDEAELHMVREAALGADMPGAKILRERLYPVKVNGANRSAVLDSNNNLLPGASEALGQENEVTIAKINWLSDKGNGKAYGSMVIYVTKESDAKRLLEGRYFHLAGESARTSTFEPRAEVVQC
jgi:TolA-binding protein